MSIDYDLFIIKSDNEDTTHSQLRDCIADAIENLQLRIELLENGDKEKTKSKEPLIKDEKIRKAVRAWAEANGLNYANCYESAHAWYLRAFNSREQGIDIEFWGYQLPKELKDCETYTITELCGEEEE